MRNLVVIFIACFLGFVCCTEDRDSNVGVKLHQQQQQQHMERFLELVLNDTTSDNVASTIVDDVDDVDKEEQPVGKVTLFPLTIYDYLGLFCSILGLLIASGSGLGGGGILVPIYILVMQIQPKYAIPLSCVTIVGGSIANTMLNIDKRHPLLDRPLIDYDLLLVFVPLTLLGALMGAYLNKILPEIVLMFLLVLLLAVTAHLSLKKAIQMYRKETIQLNASKDELMKLDVTNGSSGGGTNKSSDKNYEAVEANQNMVPNPQLQKILEDERRTPFRSVFIIVSTFLIVVTVNILKGGGGFSSPIGVKCGTPTFWLINILLLVYGLLVSVYIRYSLLEKYELKKQCNYVYLPGDVQWDENNTIKYPIICCFAGFFSGMFGIGGGMITGPILLAMNVHPEVNAASSGVMILFTALTASTSFAVFGLLLKDYAVVCLIVGFLSTYVGHTTVKHYMKKTKRNSYVAFSIGLVILVSALLLCIQIIVTLYRDAKSHNMVHANHSVCDA